MKIRCFQNTVTLLNELKRSSVARRPRGAPSLPLRDLNQATLLDLDAQGQILGITLDLCPAMEHLP